MLAYSLCGAHIASSETERKTTVKQLLPTVPPAGECKALAQLAGAVSTAQKDVKHYKMP